MGGYSATFPRAPINPRLGAAHDHQPSSTSTCRMRSTSMRDIADPTPVETELIPTRHTTGLLS